MKKQIAMVLPALAAALLLAGCAGTSTPAPAPQQPQPPAQSEPSARSDSSAPPAQTEQRPEYVQPYLDQIALCEEEDGELTYDLIDLDGDDVPELAVSHTGYFVSVYSYSDGALHTVMDHWVYGAMGNSGYEYIPGGNTVRNYNADLAGAVQYVTFFKRSETRESNPENDEMVSYYDEDLSIWQFKDANQNYFPDDDEPMDGTVYYYYGDKELTEAEFDGYLIQGDYQNIQGRDTAADMRVRLENLTK